MHSTVDYSTAPDKAAAALQDVKDWLGDRWDVISPEIEKIKNCGQFAIWASFAGVQGYPVVAWYESYHGVGSWNQTEVEGVQ